MTSIWRRVQSESSTLTTGPKVQATKIWLGPVKIGNPEVRLAYKHFVVTFYTSLNLSPLEGWSSVATFDEEKTKCSAYSAVKTMILIASLMFLYIVH